MTGERAPHAVLVELLAGLETLDDDGTIYASRPWTADSRSVVVAANDGDGTTDDRDGLSYLLEVELAREVAEVWRGWRGGRIPTSPELCRAVIHHATHDAWQPVEPWSRDDFAGLVEAMRRLHPRWFDLPADRAPSPTEVEHVQQALGCRLPADHVWFLQQYGGGDFALARFRSLDPDSDLHILADRERHPDRVVVSDDGTGLEFCFAVVDGVCPDRILVVDTDDGAVRDLDTTFLEFVVRQAFGPA